MTIISITCTEMSRCSRVSQPLDATIRRPNQFRGRFTTPIARLGSPTLSIKNPHIRCSHLHVSHNSDRRSSHHGASTSSSVAARASLSSSIPDDTAMDQDDEADVPPKSTLLSRLLTHPNDAEIFAIAIPAMFALLLDPIMSLVDTALVGRICGSEALAGVGLSGLMFSFATWIFGFLATLTTPRVATAMAQNRPDEAAQHVARSIWVALGTGTLLAAVCFLFGDQLISLLAKDVEVVKHAFTYLQWRAAAAPVLLVQFVCLGALRGLGDTRTSLYAAIVSNVVNFSLSLLFMLQFNWGVMGAASATMISQIAGSAVLFSLLLSKGFFSLRDLEKIPSWADVAPMFRAGLALSLRTLAGLVSVFSATSVVAVLGAIPLAAHEILRQMYLFSTVIFECYGITAQALIARYLGQGAPERGQAVAMRLFQLALLAGCTLAGVLWIFRDVVASTFTKDVLVTDAVLYTYPIMAFFLPIDALCITVDGVLLGAQETSYVARSMVFASVLCLSCIYLSQQFAPTLFAIWCSLKMLSIGRASFGLVKLMSRSSPFVRKEEPDV